MAGQANWLELDGKVAVVTGGAGGIGSAIIRRLAHAGAVPVALDRDEERLAALKSEMAAEGHEVLPVQCDLADEKAIETAAAEMRQQVGPADILVNNAGLAKPGRLMSLPLEDWHALLAVNLDSYFLCARAFGAHMVEKGRGAMVHIASVAAHNPRVVGGAYSVSKAGVLMLSSQLAGDLGASGVRSNVVSPGLFMTPMSVANYENDPTIRERREAMIPLGRIGETQEVADAVLFFASDRSSYMTGQFLVVDGGMSQGILTLLP
ncbi:SDR family NAD(P)-dependent oxidoreductase [Aquamicrobium sp. LC103]|uniref:SDR family NAD(P)-dependent oxidoreductase n=1 Tax=Aquamicrobium sp. LC103 TaxID=1120658 RepID=UPI00063EADA1|nr:SDR family NAD(P)-dependent oxidoreductase [Aquamicrobium sp. LC103]TKT74474.1 SDR family oxidoreductase [Aquamicrobium sp. LC103]